MSANAGPVVTYRYSFTLEGGKKRRFDVNLDEETLSMVRPRAEPQPAWTALTCRQCPNCPLEERLHPRCPIAANLVDLVEFFHDSMSYEEVDVEIETEQRKYTKHTSVQSAMSSLLGIYMVTGGCPTMDKLRPMVRFHLPFATPEETTYRAISMYLMAQYFRFRRGKEPDWELDKLVDIYENVQAVNEGFLHRLRMIEIHDANANALIILDVFASVLLLSVEEDKLDKIEVLFRGYLED